MQHTPNYNLNKPEPSDNYNVQHQNDNMDIIDAKLKEVNQRIDNLPDPIAPPVLSVNQKMGDVVLTATDVGAATPAEVQVVEQGVTNLTQTVNAHLTEDATTTQKGHIQIATPAEVTEGTNNNKAITPAGLKPELDKKLGTDYGDVITKTASFTLAITEQDKKVLMNGSAAQSITVPNNSAVPFRIGAEIVVSQQGAGTVTFVPASGVTIKSDNKRTIDGLDKGVTLTKTATNTWWLVGALK